MLHIFLYAIWLPTANFGHYHWDSLTHIMLITVFYQDSAYKSP